jgi:hypothetical protein
VQVTTLGLGGYPVAPTALSALPTPPPTEIGLQVADLGNGGGFLATITGGSPGQTNELFGQRPGLPALTTGLGALHDRILEAVTAKIQSLAIVGLAGVYLHKFPSVAKSDGPGLVVTYFGEAEEMMGGDRAADEIGFPVLIYLDAPTLVEEETRPQELLWRGQVSEALGQRLAGVPEVTTCVVEPRSVLEQGSEMLTRNPQDVANRMRSGMLFRFVARAARGADMWYGERTKQRIRGRVTEVVRAKCALLKSEHQKDLAIRYPPPSRPRQYPRLRTGNLRRAVHYKVTPAREGREAIGNVFYDLDQAYYIRYLLATGRRGLTETFARIRSRLASMSHTRTVSSSQSMLTS